jgi:hypothetical protein
MVRDCHNTTYAFRGQTEAPILVLNASPEPNFEPAVSL